MKKAFLIHGWEGSPKEGWRPWLKSQLEKSGFSVSVPLMPDSSHPRLKEWLSCIKETVGNPDKGCYFVGHSLGCIAILRYLESLGKERVGGAVLIAGFTSDLGYEEIGSFFRKPISWEKIRLRCRRFAAIHSDNDPYVSLHYTDFFRKNLKAEITIAHNMKHFSGGDGIRKLPAALAAVLKMSGN